VNCQSNKENIWIQDCDVNDIESCGFKTVNGDLVIEYGKYQMIFTDTFRNYAIVLKESEGFVGIDKDENTLFKVFKYDNGPDYVSENLFRIEKDGKIGFVNYETGQIIIQPKFSAAKPFENGYAAICQFCKTKFENEHSSWINGKWGIINKEGKVIIEPKFESIKSINTNNRLTIIENGVEKQIEIKRTR
jgi:hypothetical protein